jgi:hypothetical protein
MHGNMNVKFTHLLYYCSVTDINIEIDSINFSLCKLKWSLGNLHAFVRGGTRSISFLLRMTKFTVTTFTKQFLTVVKILAAVRLEFRSCRFNVGVYDGTWVVLLVIVSVFRRIRSTAKNDC